MPRSGSKPRKWPATRRTDSTGSASSAGGTRPASRARALVVGAGALGNEIVKNLALLGWGNVLIADMDRIENSNLSRSILYRESDNGQFKAEVAARVVARSIPP